MPRTLLAAIFYLSFFWLEFSVAMPATANGRSEIIEQIFERHENRYYFKYLTSDFQRREESGELVTKGDQQILVVKGSYTFKNNGRVYNVDYQADENGYRATMKSTIAFATSKRIGSSLVASLAGGGLG